MSAPLLEPLVDDLSTRERNALRHWLACPLHNRREDVRELFEKLCKSATSQHSLQNVDTRLTRSYLLERIEDFLRWRFRQSKENALKNDLDLLQLYRKRGLELHLTNRLRRYAKRDYGRADADALLQQYHFAELAAERNTDRARSLDPAFDEQDERLLRAHAAARLRQACLSLAGLRFSGRKTDLPLVNEYLRRVETDPSWLHEPAIALYYYICRWEHPELPDPDLRFPDFINLLQEHLPRFPASERSVLLKLVLNQAIRRVNRDASAAHLKAAFELYRLGLAENLLLDGGRLSAFTFNNFLGIALRLREMDAAHHAISLYAKLLPPEKHDEVMALNQARIAYQEGRLQEVILLLQGADYHDSVHHFNARGLLIRCYYELGEWAPAADLIRSTTQLIRRRRIGYHQRLFLNNLGLIQQLLNLNKDQATDVTAFRRAVENTEPLTYRSWLLEQLP